LRRKKFLVLPFERKAKKYEKLSSQMGFGKTLDIQNQLQTGSRLLQLEDLEKDRNKYGEGYREASGEEPKDVQFRLSSYFLPQRSFLMNHP